MFTALTVLVSLKSLHSDVMWDPLGHQWDLSQLEPVELLNSYIPL